MSAVASPKLERKTTIRKIARGFAALFMLALCAGILTLTMSEKNAANRDFISYWAAGQQLVHRANPYDGPSVLHLERAAGFLDNRPFFMRNAPPALFLALPLGLVGPRIGAILWSLLIIGCLIASIRLLRVMNGSPSNDVHLAGYIFPPVLACILAGQTGIFVLLGVVLFLRFYRSQSAAAGASLLLCALKPHLFLPFGVVLLAWAIARKAYAIIGGVVASLVLSCALSLWLDPSVWTHYEVMMRGADLRNEFIPNLSLFVRLSIDRHAEWLQFLPAAIGCVWALYYFRRHRADWDWRAHGQLLLLVSVLVAPYSWFTDETVVLPAILGGLYLGESRHRPFLPFLVLAGIPFVAVLFGVSINSGFYAWTGVAWLCWYLWLGGGRSTARHPQPCPPAREQDQSPTSKAYQG